MSSELLNWRVEAACLNAWPSPRQIILDGWAVRASGGPTRRANSANPLHGGAEASEDLIDKVESFYRTQGPPAIFRIPAMASGIDGLLDARGYRLDAPTRTLLAALDGLGDPSTDLVIEECPDAAWLDARDRLSGSAPEASRSYRDIIGAILLPCGFASVRDQGQIASLAFGAIQDELLILESVMTDPACRQRGLARACVAALMRWGRERGARSVALQVMADNDPAIGLYRGLGISGDLYGYHYRIRQDG